MRGPELWLCSSAGGDLYDVMDVLAYTGAAQTAWSQEDERWSAVSCSGLSTNENVRQDMSGETRGAYLQGDSSIQLCACLACVNYG